jgi:hypothetical protein
MMAESVNGSNKRRVEDSPESPSVTPIFGPKGLPSSSSEDSRIVGFQFNAFDLNGIHLAVGTVCFIYYILKIDFEDFGRR